MFTATEGLRSLQDSPETPTPMAGPLRPEQLLAAAVIRQALIDAWSCSAAPLIRDRARAFLRPDSDGLAFWCGIAGLRPDVVARLAEVQTRPLGGRPPRSI
jgi:hypothetical protein